MSDDAEFCPGADHDGLPPGHHFVTRLLALEGVIVWGCISCPASRITLSAGLGPFLAALEQQFRRARSEAFGGGQDFAAGWPPVTPNWGLGPESAPNRDAGTNQEHAQNPIGTPADPGPHYILDAPIDGRRMRHRRRRQDQRK